MWAFGALLGLGLGILMESFGGALVLAAIGGMVAFAIARQIRNSDGEADEVLRQKLERRVAALESRVEQLTRQVQQPPVAAPATGGGHRPVEPAPQPAPLEPPAPQVTPSAVAAPMPVVPPAPVAAPNPPAQPKPIFASEPALQSVPVPPPRPPAPPPAPAVPLRDRLPAPIAQLIFGGNLLVKLGVLILFLGLAFLLRYTAERVTLPVEFRYAGVALAGVVLLGIGWRLRTKRADYALTLQGAGIGVLYLTTLAAMKISALLPLTAGFGVLFAVAVLSAILAVLQNAPVLAIVAALEGFAAPVLSSSGSNQPVGLFSYLLILDLGIALIAWFKAWRPLNLIGFVGTFTLAGAWAHQHYSDDQYALIQAFLIAFFLLFTGIGLMFARRTLFDLRLQDDQPLRVRAVSTLQRAGRVDSSLVFGTPMVAFALQYLLMRPWEYGAAISAVVLATFYVALGWGVLKTQPRGLALLAEAYAIVGVIFGTLAIPLGLEGQWTGAAWAVEAAGMYWLGARQQRRYARFFAFAVFLGGTCKLLAATQIDGLPGHSLLHGTLIGPLLVAGSAFAMWASHRRAKLDQEDGLEAGLARLLPWFGMGGLALLPWQLLTPNWATAATALLGSATLLAATRLTLPALRRIGHTLQGLAVAGFALMLHAGTVEGQALQGGWAQIVAACLIALSLLASAVVTLLRVHRAALAADARPQWSFGSVLGLGAGVVLLHLAMLFQLSTAQAALVWPLTATVLLWIALRMAHAPLATMSAGLQVASAMLFISAWIGQPVSESAPAFAHLAFWTPAVLGVCALLGGDWARAAGVKGKPWPLPWATESLTLWMPVVWGLGWLLFGLLEETGRVLWIRNLVAYIDHATLAIVLIVSAASSWIAQRRDWRQLAQATLATLPALLLIALGMDGAAQPSAHLGWLVWPLALVWHVTLLHRQQPWASKRVLQPLHVVGFWLFLALATRECEMQMSALGDRWSSWPLLGFALAPALALWALRSPALLGRWPLSEFRLAYLGAAAAPVAAFLLLWVWTTNAWSAGDAAPLLYLPVLNPLELAQLLALFAIFHWWRRLQADDRWPGPPAWAPAVLGVTAFALLTGAVLRACHHYAGVPWDFDALYASRLTQAALSITWSICAVATMMFANRKVSRVIWMAGAALLGLVVVKLFLVELADRGGLFRIVSFLVVGVLLLLVGYFAPVPPKREDGREDAPMQGEKT